MSIPSVWAQDTRVQTLRGLVVERATQIPLPGANVVVLDSDPVIGSTTDGNGSFVLNGVPLGRHDIRITFLGFEPVVLSQVLVTSGKEVVLRAELDELVLQGQEIEIVAEPRRLETQNDHAYVSARSFSVEETRRYAGGLDDPARMASSFAGVSTGGGIAENALIIRGNAPKGVSWRLEGVEIPNPNHFAGLSVAGGGGVTLFSSQLLAESDFFTGAFPAEFGNALAGVFDMRFRTGNRWRREHTVQAGLLGVEAASEGPFMRGRPSTYLFNYRYSTLGLLLPLLPTEDIASYQDLSFKLSFPSRRAGRFDLWGIGGLDRQAMSASTDSTEWEYETWDRLDSDLRLNLGASGLTHVLIIGRRSYVQSAAAVSINQAILDQLRVDDDLVMRGDLRLRNTQGRFMVTSHLNHKFGARHTNRTGFTVQRHVYGLDVRSRHPKTPVSNALHTVARGSGSTELVQAYTQSRIDATRHLTLHAGFHIQSLTLTGRTSLEPRVGLRLAVGSNQFLNAGYGLHSQMEDLRIYLARPIESTASEQPNRRLRFARAHHAVMGYDRRIGETSRLKIETFFQRLFDVPVVDDSSYSLINFEQDFTFAERLINAGAGENFGLEVTLERSLADGFYYLLTGSTVSSRYRGGDGIWRRSRYDRGYYVNVLVGKEYTVAGDNLLGLNLRVNAMGGKRRSPVDPIASRALEDVVFDESRAFELREPDLFLFDVTVTYRRNRSRVSEVWALQIKNLLAAKDVSHDYNFATRTVDQVKEGYPLPVLSYKIEF